MTKKVTFSNPKLTNKVTWGPKLTDIEPKITSSDLQWPTVTYSDLQWPTVTYSDPKVTYSDL